MVSPLGDEGACDLLDLPGVEGDRAGPAEGGGVVEHRDLDQGLARRGLQVDGAAVPRCHELLGRHLLAPTFEQRVRPRVLEGRPVWFYENFLVRDLANSTPGGHAAQVQLVVCMIASPPCSSPPPHCPSTSPKPPPPGTRTPLVRRRTRPRTAEASNHPRVEPPGTLEAPATCRRSLRLERTCHQPYPTATAARVRHT